MANRNWMSGGKIYSMHVSPVLLDCNFKVDSTESIGISNLKGPCIESVTMYGLGSGPTPPSGSPVLGSAANMAILAASTITNTGSTVVTGEIGLYPGTSVTGFPPGIVSGIQHIADGVASQAQTDAMAAYVDLSTRVATAISDVLDGATLTAGVYTETSGTFNLAASGNATLTFNGSATDIFVMIAASTLVTGAGGIPTIALTGGALASNIYWVCGSSATINSGSAGTFNGNVIAFASVTDTMGGTVNGNLIALTGAVTISAAANLNAVNGASLSPGAPAQGTIVVRLEDKYNRYLSGFKAIISPPAAPSLKIDNSALTAGVAYTISTLGNSSAAAWHLLGVPAGIVPALGVSFIAASVGAGANSSTSRVAAALSSGIATIEMVGDPNMSVNPNPSANQGFGSQFIFECRDYAGAKAAPVDGSIISLAFLLSNSSVIVQGE